MMTVCRYRRLVSKEGKPFVCAGTGVFKSREHKEVIERWNKRGERNPNTVIDVAWKYEIMKTKSISLSESDNMKIPYMTSSAC